MPKGNQPGKRKKGRANNTSKRNQLSASQAAALRLSSIPNNARAGSTSTAAEYLRCLIEPETYTSKIPNPVPVTTHLAQAKGCVSLSTNADGYMVGWVAPHLNSLITYCNTGTITDSSTYSGLTYSSISSTSVNIEGFRRRVVACSATVELLSPNMTRRGILTGTFMTFQPSTVAGVATDTIRDLPDSLTLNAAKNPAVRILYKPFDPACSDFQLSGVGVNGSFPCLVFAISGAEPASTVMIKYRVVYEVIPSPTFADLLMPTPGPIGSPNDISTAVSNVAHVVAHEGQSFIKGITQRAVSSLSGTAGLFMRGAALALPYIAGAASKMR